MYHIVLLTFQHTRATNIPLVLLVTWPPMHYGFTTPKMTDQTSKGLPQKAEVTECHPTLQHAVSPSIQDTWSDLQCLLSRIVWIALETLTNTLPPRRHPLSIHPLPSRRQSHNEDSCQWNKLV